MTMPHLMNCQHSCEGWCMECVKLQWLELDEALIQIGRYESCLGAVSNRLQSALPIGEVKAIGLMEVPAAVEELIADRDALKAALKTCRKTMLQHGLTMRAFASECGISPVKLSEWTAEPVDGPPDIVCRGNEIAW